MKIRIAAAVAVVLALALALAAGAQAALPKPKTMLIVPGRSIAGLEVGKPETAVAKAWGPGGCTSGTCSYEGKKGTGETAVAYLEERQGTPPKIWMVFISANIADAAKPNFEGPVSKYRTAKGIGLGSSLAEVRRAYKAVKKTGPTTYVLSGPGEAETQFGFGSDGRVINLQISAHPGG